MKQIYELVCGVICLIGLLTILIGLFWWPLTFVGLAIMGIGGLLASASESQPQPQPQRSCETPEVKRLKELGVPEQDAVRTTWWDKLLFSTDAAREAPKSMQEILSLVEASADEVGKKFANEHRDAPLYSMLDTFKWETIYGHLMLLAMDTGLEWMEAAAVMEVELSRLRATHTKLAQQAWHAEKQRLLSQAMLNQLAHYKEQNRLKALADVTFAVGSAK